MTTFILIAIVLTIAAVAVVAVPLLRRSSTASAPAIGAAFGAAGLLVFGGAALYATWSNWSWKTAEAADTPQGMVSGLARRLEKNPADLDGWLMLGRSYTVLEQYPLAVRAYQRADRLAEGRNAEALFGMGEALVSQDIDELDGRGGRYIEQALQLDPRNGGALFYGAAAALRRGELPLARQRFVDMLALNPPANVRPILEQQIAAIDEKLAQEQGGAPTANAGGSGPAAGPAQGAPGAAPRTAQAPADSASRSEPSAGVSGEVPPVRVKVTLSPKLAADVPSAAPLFVIVRDPRRAGPPLAVKRLSSTFPQTVELTTADSMLPSHTFTKGQLVEVVARVSRTGSPTESPGDPFGLAAHRVGDDGVVDIEIAHVSR